MYSCCFQSDKVFYVRHRLSRPVYVTVNDFSAVLCFCG